jgi:hypothetical protein
VVASDDFHNRVLAQADVSADQAVGESLPVKGEDALGLLVGWALSDLATEEDSAGAMF